MTIWPGCRPLVIWSRSAKPVGTPVREPSRLAIDSISSSARVDLRHRKSSLVRRSVTSNISAWARSTPSSTSEDVAELGDAHARLDEAAHRPPGHDLRVVAGIRRSGHRIYEGVQIRRATHAIEHPRLVSSAATLTVSAGSPRP